MTRIQDWPRDTPLQEGRPAKETDKGPPGLQEENPEREVSWEPREGSLKEERVAHRGGCYGRWSKTMPENGRLWGVISGPDGSVLGEQGDEHLEGSEFRES